MYDYARPNHVEARIRNPFLPTIRVDGSLINKDIPESRFFPLDNPENLIYTKINKVIGE